jgi:hypothetical protein
LPARGRNHAERVVFLTSKIQLGVQLLVVFSIVAGDVELRGRLPNKTLIRHDTFLVEVMELLRCSTKKYNFGCILLITLLFHS